MEHIPYNPRRVSDAECLAILQEELTLASARRSVRFFRDQPVDRQVIDSLIYIAGTAPSGANMQPWHFVAIDDPALKKQIRIAAEQEEREFYERRATPEWLEALAPLGTDCNKPFLEVAPWLIIVFRKKWLNVGDQQVKTYYSTESVGIAVGLLISAIHRAGLVTLTHTPAPMTFLREMCQRPESETPFVILPIGYAAEDCTVPNISRKPLSEIMQHNAESAHKKDG